MALSIDGSTLVTGGHDQNINLIEIERREVSFTFKLAHDRNFALSSFGS